MSISGVDPEIFTKDVDNETLSCLGDSILRDCSRARGTVDSVDYGRMEFYVEGNEDYIIEEDDKEEALCEIRTELKQEEQISIKDNKKFADSTLVCPVEVYWFREKIEELGIDLDVYPGAVIPFSLSFYRNTLKMIRV